MQALVGKGQMKNPGQAEFLSPTGPSAHTHEHHVCNGICVYGSPVTLGFLNMGGSTSDNVNPEPPGRHLSSGPGVGSR
jgi:hypothetical protein